MSFTTMPLKVWTYVGLVILDLALALDAFYYHPDI